MFSPGTPAGAALRFIGDITMRFAIVSPRALNGRKSPAPVRAVDVMSTRTERRDAEPARGNEDVLCCMRAPHDDCGLPDAARGVRMEVVRTVDADPASSCDHRIANLGCRRVKTHLAQRV